MEEVKLKNDCEPVLKDEQDNSITSFNIGSSDYSKMNIQPWDLWLYFNDGWRCDIIKRLLRHKKSSIFDRIFHPFTCDSRINDYRKIKHIILKIEDVYFNTPFKYNYLNKNTSDFRLLAIIEQLSNILTPNEYKILTLILSIDRQNIEKLKVYIDILIGAEVNNHLYYRIIEKFSNKHFNF